MKTYILRLIGCTLLFGIEFSAVAQYVGINAPTPYSRLHVDGTSWFQGDNTPLSASAGAGIGIGFGNGATGGYIFSFNYANFTYRNLWLQHGGGSVVIGSTTASPQARLDILGNGSRALYASTNSGEAFYGTSSGGHAITGVSTSNLGMYAISQGTLGAGLLSEAPYIGTQGTVTGSNANKQAIRGENLASAGGYAGLFNGGTTWVVGTLQKSAGAFLIDHPKDPENKFLYHSFVESPDMKNIYDGMVSTDAKGFAVVEMPSWFDSLNINFRYQLTCIGQFAQAIVKEELTSNKFVIQTNLPNVKVSWQVTGIRNDPYARDNRIPVEKLKVGNEVGKYIYPQGYNKDQEYSLDILKPTNLGEVKK